MGKIGDLFWEFRGSSEKLRADAAKAGDMAGKTLGQKLTYALKKGDWGTFVKTGLGLGAGLAAFNAAQNIIGGVADSVGDMISAASDLEESQSKVNQVFTDSADIIHDWAEGSAEGFGLSKQAALEAAGTFGNFIQALGGSEEQANQMSRSLVELAADLASFNNMEVDDVLTSLRSGLAGEAEPMRRLGADISAARVEAILLANGVEKVNGKFTEAQKVQGRYQAIIEDTAKAQGDFARTSDGLANKQRILDARLQDLQATLGALVVGPATDFLGFLIDVIDLSPKVSDKVAGINERIAENAKVTEEAAAAAEAFHDDWRPLTELDIPPIFRTGQYADLTDEILEYANSVRLTDEELRQFLFTNDDSVGSLREAMATIEDAKDAYDPLSSLIGRTADETDGLADAMGTAEPSILGLSKATLQHRDALLRLSDAYEAARERQQEFKDSADEIAGTRSLSKINKELREQRKALREAAEAGNVRKFAAATAAIEQLKQERKLRKQGREALREYKDRTTEEGKAQQKVTQKIIATTEKLRALGNTTANPRVTIAGIEAAQSQLTRLRETLASLRAEAGVTYDPITGQVRTVAPRAAGGPVHAGRPYWVGEEGPELVVPRSAATVIPTEQSLAAVTSGGQTVHAEIFGLPMQAETPREVVQQLRRASSTGLIKRSSPRGFAPA